MSQKPYTGKDIEAAARRIAAAAIERMGYAHVSELLEDKEVTPGGGVLWDDFSEETFNEAVRDILKGLKVVETSLLNHRGN